MKRKWQAVSEAFSYRTALLLVFAFVIANNSWSQPVAIEPGVSIELAHQRAKALKNISYQLFLNIKSDSETPILGQLVIDFELNEVHQPLQLDFQQTPEHIHSVSNASGVIDYEFKHEHLIIPASALTKGANRLEIHFTAGESSLNRNPDYLYTLFVPDRARTAFPLFDQPDLKAHYELSLQLPIGWDAISNAPLKEKKEADGGVLYHFENSELTSSYLFSFVAGRFERASKKIDGRTISLLHRETDDAKVSRNLDAIFDLHHDAINWMENYTGILYPFAKFDFALIPSFQYAGMEHPGAIQYRASSLFLEESPTQSQLLDRAALIAHETAHMWFGNLVTMQWFNDVWTKEVFANFMAAKIVNPAFPGINHELNFLMRHYPGAYMVDRSAGSNPIRQELANLNEAGQMYGPIIYKKAPIMMRQLELLLGEDSLQKGLQRYLECFAFANATWPELIAILDTLSPKKLHQWSDVWVNTPGRPHFQLATDSEQGTVLTQKDPNGGGRIWPQQFSVASEAGTVRVNSAAHASVLLAPALQVNSDGLGYGLFPVNKQRWDDQKQLDELARGALLIDTWENFLSGDFGDTSRYFEILLARTSVEENPLILEQILAQLYRLHASFLSAEEQTRLQPSLENALLNELNAARDAGQARLFFNALSGMALTAKGLAYLEELWTGRKHLETVPLSETDLTHLAEVLALRLPDDADKILAKQRTRIENPDLLRRFDFVTPALSPDSKVRDSFFLSLEKPQNRTTESWVLDALTYLHHPSRISQSEKYILPSLKLLEEIQVTGDIFFPSGWLNNTLLNHRSQTAVKLVNDFLAQRPDYNTQLRMKILQAVDMAQRASQHHGQNKRSG